MFKKCVEPAHLVAEGSKEVCADEIGDGGWKEGRPKFPFVTEHHNHEDDDDHNDGDHNHKHGSNFEAKVQFNLPMVSIMCKGREGSSMAMPMLAKVIAPDE